MKMLKNLDNYKFLLFSAYSLAAIWYQLSLGLAHYSLLFLIFFIILFWFYKNTLPIDNEKKKYVIPMSAIVALILTVGKQVDLKEYAPLWNLSIFGYRTIFEIIFYGIGLFILLYYVFSNLFLRLDSINILDENREKYSKKVFGISFLVILLAYVPYFLRVYPAVLTADSYYQIKTIENGEYSNLHPFVQTQFVGMIYKLGKLIFGAGNAAIALYTVVQMSLIALVFSYLVYFLYKKNVKIPVLVALVLFFALSPLHAFYSVTIWKDIVFGINFVFVAICLYNLCDNYTVKNVSLFVASVLLILFFRNNGIYIFLFMIPFLIISFKKNRRSMTAVLAGVLAVYYIVSGPIYSAIGVKSTKSTEAFSIPLQQIARVIVTEDELENDTHEFLSEIMDVEAIKVRYTPHISDPVKNSVYIDKFDENKVKFIATWAKMFFKYPKTYIEAYLASTVGFWNPDTLYYYTTGQVGYADEIYNAYDYNIMHKSLLSEKTNDFIDSLMLRENLFSVIIWSTGLYCLILFITFIIAVYKKRYKYLVVYAPFFGIWISMMVASPVYAELRYIYGIFTVVPFLILIPFLKNKNESVKTNKIQ